MLYKIYTDGSVNREKKLMGFSFVIVTNKDFITMKQFKTTGVAPTKAEIIAVGMAAEYMLNKVELKEGDSVTFHVDSAEALSYFSSSEDKLFSNTSDQRIILAKDMIEDLRSKVNVNLKKVWAHSSQTGNGNALADRLVKYALAVSR